MAVEKLGGARAELVAACIASAREIMRDLAALDLADGSLGGAAAARLLWHELGPVAPRAPRTLRRWDDQLVAALDELDASLYDGMLGAAWVLSRVGAAGDELAAVDAAVIELLEGGPWPGGLAPFDGGLVGFGVYGLSRRRTKSGRRIVAACVAQLAELATREGGAVRWRPGAAALPHPARAREIRLLNLDGAAAAVGLLGHAARLGTADAHELAIAGAETLVADLARPPRPSIGAAVSHAMPGLVHGDATWALGSAGTATALLAVDPALAAPLGRQLADLAPDASNAIDTSLGTGTAGIAVVLDALATATGGALFAHAAEHWIRRTLRARDPGRGLGGYLHFDALRDAADGGSRWAARPGFLEGASGTALALARFARATRAPAWPGLLLL